MSKGKLAVNNKVVTEVTKRKAKDGSRTTTIRKTESSSKEISMSEIDIGQIFGLMMTASKTPEQIEKVDIDDEQQPALIENKKTPKEDDNTSWGAKAIISTAMACFSLLMGPVTNRKMLT